MPLPKPHKGEAQDAFMSRCMHEAYGADAPSDRTQEQAVAMCFDAWRSKDKRNKQEPDLSLEDCPDPEEDESENEYLDRCMAEMEERYGDELSSVIDEAEEL